MEEEQIQPQLPSSILPDSFLKTSTASNTQAWSRERFSFTRRCHSQPSPSLLRPARSLTRRTPPPPPSRTPYAPGHHPRLHRPAVGATPGGPSLAAGRSMPPSRMRGGGRRARRLHRADRQSLLVRERRGMRRWERVSRQTRGLLAPGSARPNSLKRRSKLAAGRPLLPSSNSPMAPPSHRLRAHSRSRSSRHAYSKASPTHRACPR